MKLYTNDTENIIDDHDNKRTALLYASEASSVASTRYFLYQTVTRMSI